jgi:3-phenylpropionate/trans-cinnamate dioxygenase ferredoxin reductase subunit
LPDRIVIVGGGQAAVQAADTLRREGHDGPITLVAGEAQLPYHRPPLSKAGLAPTAISPSWLKPEAFYADKRVDLRCGRKAVEVDRSGRRVGLDDGVELPYERLLLATGSRVRQLPMAAALPANRVHYLKTWDDAQRLRAAMRPGAQVGVIGAGFIGLEFAAVACKQGMQVSVFEAGDRVLARVTRPEISRHLQDVHGAQGIRLMLEVSIAAIRQEGSRILIDSSQGRHEVDFLLVGIGVQAEDALARTAGLDCDEGILVDAACRTSDPHIFAAGDCTRAPRFGAEGLLRLESVDNAVSQGTVAARAMLGKPALLDGVPWFWSEQYDEKLIIIGLSAGHDALVLRGDPRSGAFSLCYLREGVLVAVDCMNRAADSVAARKLVAAAAVIDPVKAADPAVPLKDCLG